MKNRENCQKLIKISFIAVERYITYNY